MNVLLIYPPYPYESVSTFEEPVGILYVAASLIKAGYEVHVADLTFNPAMEGLAERIRRADVVGISAPTPLFAAAQAVMRRVREIKPSVFMMLGGPYGTTRPGDALNAGFDAVVVGEGEKTACELVAALEHNQPLAEVCGIVYREDKEQRATAAREFIPSLDEIPFPARQFIDYSKYRRLGVICMRGCPYRCIYCKPVEDKLFGRKLRCRSVENIVEEIALWLKVIGNRQVSFKDDTLTVHKTEWFLKLAQELSRHGLKISWQCSSRVDCIDLLKLRAMKEAGCRQIFFGIESGSQAILDYYRKDIKVEETKEAFDVCRRAGIRACASIMLGAPPETRQDLAKTYELVKTIKPFNWHVHVTTPICGSYLYDDAKAQGRLTAADDFSSAVPTGNVYRLRLPMKLDHLTKADIADYRDRINSYMKFRVLLRCMCDPRMWKELLLSRGFQTIAINFLRRHFLTKLKPETQPS